MLNPGSKGLLMWLEYVSEDIEKISTKSIPSLGLHEHFTLEQEEYLIGRYTGCDLYIVDNGVRNISRKHASIVFTDEEFCLIDLNSGNGTFIKHLPEGVAEEQESFERLQPHTPYPLKKGEIALGNSLRIGFEDMDRTTTGGEQLVRDGLTLMKYNGRLWIRHPHQETQLPPRERELLYLLMSSQEPVSDYDIIKGIWGEDQVNFRENSAIQDVVTRTRNRLRLLDPCHEYIHRDRQAKGYIFTKEPVKAGTK